MKESSGTVYPSAVEAEDALLGCLLTSNELLNEVMSIVKTPEYFYDKNNAYIYRAILELHQSEQDFDMVTISNHAKENKWKEFNVYAMTGLLESGGIPSNTETYAKIIAEKYVQRKMLENVYKLEEASKDNTITANEQLVAHQRFLDELTSFQPTKSMKFGDIVDNAVETMTEDTQIIPFGIDALDSPAGGMTRKEITILGGRPGHGKTTLMLNCMLSLLNKGYKVMVFNREMSNPEMIKKMVVHQSELPYAAVRRMTLDDKQQTHFDATIEHMKTNGFEENLLMYDNVRDLATTLREIQRHTPDVVIDDYIQLIRVDDVGGRRFEIERILVDYKWMCKKVNCSALILSQLSRDIDKRMEPEPRLSDYAESGVIEQVAETAMFVFYGYNFDHEEYPQYESKIITAKSRYGEIGSYLVGFNGNRCKFYDSMESAMRDEQIKSRMETN